MLGNLTERVSPREEMESRSLGALVEPRDVQGMGVCMMQRGARSRGVQDAAGDSALGAVSLSPQNTKAICWVTSALHSSFQAALSRTTHPGHRGGSGCPGLGLLNCDHGNALYLSALRSQNQAARG